MCAVHTLPYLSHKMVKTMFLLDSLIKFSCTNYLVLIMVCCSSCRPFPSIYNLTICIRKKFTRFEARKYILRKNNGRIIRFSPISNIHYNKN